MALGPRKFRRILVSLAILVLALLGIGALGYRLGWHHRGFDAEQLARLEADWEHLIELAAEPLPSPLSTTVTAEDEAFGAELRAWADATSRARVPESRLADELLIHLREHPNSSPVEADGTPHRSWALSGAVHAALENPALHVEDLVRLAQLARRIQAGNDWSAFINGTAYLELVLDHVESDPTHRTARAKALRVVPPPRRDEVFLAFCRQVLRMESRVLGLPREGASTPENPFTPAPDPESEPPSYEFVDLAFLRAELDRLWVLESMRDRPASWESFRSPKPIEGLALWWAVESQDPEVTTQIAASMLQYLGLDTGPRWAELVDRWQRLVGN